MLTDLHIENFAIIQSLDLSPSAGLVTFTGETGAGKSIILDAITAVIGGRAEVTAIRAGAERAIVEASFLIPEDNRAPILEILRRGELDDDPARLTLSREIRREGRNIARINGRSVPVSLLREVGSYLVDIHGQTEHLSLLVVRSHLALLDRYAADEEAVAAYHKEFTAFTALRRELAALRQDEQDAARRSELLAFQVREIEAAHLQPGEEETLQRERNRLANAENLASLTQQALLLLEGGQPESPSVSDLLVQVAQALASISRLDPSQESLSAQVSGLMDSLGEVTLSLQDYQETLEFDPHRLQELEERLELIHGLKRKYGGSVEAALAFGLEARQKLESITHAGERIARLEEEERSRLESLGVHGRALAEIRRQAAVSLAAAVETELADLSMAGARFKVEIRQEPDPRGVPGNEGQPVAFDSTGLDRVEFLIAPNPGEGFKPLVKIASGGETSRLMLALKNVLVQADPLPTLIFDEIDQGIGGRIGSVVGEKLWQLGRRHQVFCVTHLPQLAAFGDQHLNIQKIVSEGRTVTTVEVLEGDRRRDELALMLGGLNDANRSAAEGTLLQARQRSSQLG